LATFTGFLFYYTRKLAADAARTARDEFLATHRPQIAVRHFKVTSGPDEKVFTIRFAAFNVGDSIAKNVRCRATAEFFDPKQPLPPWMDIGFRRWAEPEDLARGHFRAIEIIIPRDNRQLGTMLVQGYALHAYGVVEYECEDGLSSWTTAFGRRELITHGRFVPVDDSDYEYQD
jgi:hypothetical protein